jgi:hypothetical protein
VEGGGTGLDGEYKTVKVRKDTYEALKRMGVGIGKAIEMLVKQQEQAVTRKIEDIEKAGRELAELFLKHGLFDIKLNGAGISGVTESGDVVRVSGYIDIRIPNDEARQKLVEVLKGV